MDSLIIGAFNAIMSSQSVPSISAEILSIALMFIMYKYFLKPIKDKLDNMPDKNEIIDVINVHAITNEKKHDEIMISLKVLSDFLDGIEDIDKASSKELGEIRRDLIHVREVLNQFQGHMLYSGNDRRSGDFGNRELR